jgi:hypothetical protein
MYCNFARLHKTLRITPAMAAGLADQIRFGRTRFFDMSAAANLTTVPVTLSSLFHSRAALELENLALRHQIGVLQRAAIRRPRLTLVGCLLGLAVPHLGCVSGATLHVDFNFLFDIQR